MGFTREEMNRLNCTKYGKNLKMEEIHVFPAGNHIKTSCHSHQFCFLFNLCIYRDFENHAKYVWNQTWIIEIVERACQVGQMKKDSRKLFSFILKRTRHTFQKIQKFHTCDKLITVLESQENGVFGK